MTFWVCKRKKKGRKKLTIAEDVEFCHMSKEGQPDKSKRNGNRGPTKEKEGCPTCYSGTISDADAATHEHDAFDRVQEVRINAYEERNIRQRSRSYDGDGGLGAVRAGIKGLCPPGDRGGDGLDGGTTVIDAPSHQIRVTRRKSLNTPEPVGAVDLGIVPRRPDKRHCCATVHLDVRWSRKRVQAPRGVYLSILGGGVSVHLANRSAGVRAGCIRASYRRNAEKLYIVTMKCQQDGSSIIMSLASHTVTKKPQRRAQTRTGSQSSQTWFIGRKRNVT